MLTWGGGGTQFVNDPYCLRVGAIQHSAGYGRDARVSPPWRQEEKNRLWDEWRGCVMMLEALHTRGWWWDSNRKEGGAPIILLAVLTILLRWYCSAALQLLIREVRPQTCFLVTTMTGCIRLRGTDDGSPHAPTIQKWKILDMNTAMLKPNLAVTYTLKDTSVSTT